MGRPLAAMWREELSQVALAQAAAALALLQGWRGEGLKVLFLPGMPETAVLAGGPRCWVLLPSPPPLAFLPCPLTAEDEDNGSDGDDSNC